MRYQYISVLLVLLFIFGQVEHVFGQDDSPEIIGDCRVELELKPGQGCATPGGGTFSIQTDGCALVTSSGPFTTTNHMYDSTRCESPNGQYVANRISTNPLTWRIESVTPQQEIIGDCRAGLELKPGQGCSVPDRGFFSIRADGCVGITPSVSGAFSMGVLSSGAAGSTCIKGKWSTGEFAASQFSSDPLRWRINSVPPGQAN